MITPRYVQVVADLTATGKLVARRGTLEDVEIHHDPSCPLHPESPREGDCVCDFEVWQYGKCVWKSL